MEAEQLDEVTNSKFRLVDVRVSSAETMEHTGPKLILALTLSDPHYPDKKRFARVDFDLPISQAKLGAKLRELADIAENVGPIH